MRSGLQFQILTRSGIWGYKIRHCRSFSKGDFGSTWRLHTRTAAWLICTTLVLAIVQSCSDNEYSESATRVRLSMAEDVAAHYEARFGDVVVRIPKNFLPLDVSWYRERRKLSSLHLSKMPWPPDSETSNMVPEGRYIDISLYRTDRQPGRLQEHRFSVLDDQEDWGGTGFRRLVYDVRPSRVLRFGTEVFVSGGGQMRALCSADVSEAIRACYQEHSDEEYRRQLNICYLHGIQEVIEADEPLAGRCEARQDYPGGLTVVYEFPQRRISEWLEIDSFTRSLVDSWIVVPVEDSDVRVSN